MKATTFKDRDEQEMKTDDKNKLWITKILQKKLTLLVEWLILVAKWKMQLQFKMGISRVQVMQSYGN